MSAESGTVWIGLRADGVELMRVEATCVEVSRSNGIATYEVLGMVLFADVPCDAANPSLTVSHSEHGTPFQSAEIRHVSAILAGQHLTVGPVTFDAILEVPRYVPPPEPSKPRRIRLGR